MKLEVVSEKENPLRKRKGYWLSVEHAGKETPSRHELLPQVAKKLGSKEELTIIDKIFSERGNALSRVKVLVYKDKLDIPQGKLARQTRKVKSYLEKKSKKKAEESAPAEKPEEGPGEETKEEKPPEKVEEEKEEKDVEEVAEAEEQKAGEEAEAEHKKEEETAEAAETASEEEVEEQKPEESAKEAEVAEKEGGEEEKQAETPPEEGRKRRALKRRSRHA